MESCRYDERLAALFSLPSDADTRVALNQLHALKYGVTRQKDRPVTVYELETYYNPRALPPIVAGQVHGCSRAGTVPALRHMSDDRAGGLRGPVR